MKKCMNVFLFIVGLLAISSCEKETFDNLGNDELWTSSEAKGLAMMCNIEGCPVNMNGGIEIGTGNWTAFSSGWVDLWTGAFGTADRLGQYQGVNPFEGQFMAHMQRYKANPNYYEAILSDIRLKERNNYCLSYQSRGDNLDMEVYAA